MTLGLITSVLSLLSNARHHLTAVSTPPAFPPPPFQPPLFQPPLFEPPPFQPSFEPPPFQPSFEPPPFQPSRFDPPPQSQFREPQPSFDPAPGKVDLIPLPNDLGPPSTAPDFIPPSRFDAAPPRPPSPVFDETPPSSTSFESLLPPPKSRSNRGPRLSRVDKVDRKDPESSSNPPSSSPSSLDDLVRGHIGAQIRNKRYSVPKEDSPGQYPPTRKSSYRSSSGSHKKRVQTTYAPPVTSNAQLNQHIKNTIPPSHPPSSDNSGSFSLEPAHPNALIVPAAPLDLESSHRKSRQAPPITPTTTDIPLDGTLTGPLQAADRAFCVNRIKHATLNNHAYFFPWEEPGFRNLKSHWLAARNFCRKRCMDLVSLETAEENTLIREKIMRSGKNMVWTSGRMCDFAGCDRADLFPLRRNGWFWAASGTRILASDTRSGFQDWAVPNGKRSKPNRFPQGRESCMVIGTTVASSQPRWTDLACQTELQFVCEDSDTLLRLANVT